ncbi:MurR/RpiR family transcriptional regulator [Microbacterium sp. p3-SID338]|uniref:MurR/RpiR family transcriptional regulator n=1 Tax=unclassified Microbacterium TaxID=2609290 RepID=UPI00078865F2|nr:MULTISPECIES: MurR/RpiR family transcriptional regulator [unclassified Microbacterium]KYK00297.1 RpiR family transcriptional regulator [Microbacterium sp. CH1]MCT1396860.1 MurR/RpiR family transcriptional regulator [Microbacterium sp. p3-SID338]PMC04022.1 MurR/RpiR family transcriptional regulator [Microbacterium sp. UMB0228]
MFAPSAPPTVRIAAVRNTLQPAERRVAELILDSADAVVEWTAQELADRAGVGRATVVRACQGFGYRGYPQLRVALAAELGGGSADAAVDHGPGVLGRMRGEIDRVAASLPVLASLLDPVTVDAAVAATASARRVLVLANGLSSPIASDLAMRLTAAGRPAEFIADAIAQQIAARHLTEQDVCVIVSGSGANEASLRVATAADRGGATVIALTSFASSALTDAASLSLVIAPAGVSFREELQHASRVAFLVFAEVFAAAVTSARGDDAVQARAYALEVVSDNLDG